MPLSLGHILNKVFAIFICGIALACFYFGCWWLFKMVSYPETLPPIAVALGSGFAIFWMVFGCMIFIAGICIWKSKPKTEVAE